MQAPGRRVAGTTQFRVSSFRVSIVRRLRSGKQRFAGEGARATNVLTRGHLDATISTKVLELLPELRPGQAGRAADEDVRVVRAFLVVNAERIAIVAGKAAGGE